MTKKVYHAPGLRVPSVELSRPILDSSEEPVNPSPWKKILKLFVEFVIAAVTALVTTLSGQAMNVW